MCNVSFLLWYIPTSVIRAKTCLPSSVTIRIPFAVSAKLRNQWNSKNMVSFYMNFLEFTRELSLPDFSNATVTNSASKAIRSPTNKTNGKLSIHKFLYSILARYITFCWQCSTWLLQESIIQLNRGYCGQWLNSYMIDIDKYHVKID